MPANPETSSAFDIDDVSSELQFGRFQVLNLSFTSLAIFLSILSSESFVFTARDTRYRCKLTECEVSGADYNAEYAKGALPIVNGISSKCQRYSSTLRENASDGESCLSYEFNDMDIADCDEWIYQDKNTIVEDFGIPCEGWKLTLVGTVNGVAHILNFFVGGILADRYGRKLVMIVMATLAAVFGMIQSHSNNYWTFAVLEFLNMALSSGSFTSAFVLGIELLPKERRLLGSMLLHAACGLSSAFVGLIAWGIPYWRHLLIAANIPSLLMLMSINVVPESYLWLYSQGRYSECAVIIRKAAAMNNITLSKNSRKFLESIDVEPVKLINADPKSDQNPGLFELSKSKVLMKRLWINCLVWFVTLFVYDGLTITSVSLGASDNIYLNFILVSLIEIPGHGIFLLILDRFGRKLSLVWTFALSGIVILSHAFIPTTQIASLITAYLVGKLIITITSDIVFIYTSELFPTSMRNSTLNLCALAGAIGISVAPQVPLLLGVHKGLPMVVFGLTPIIAAVFALRLPETVDADLPETIEEAENVGTLIGVKKKRVEDRL